MSPALIEKPEALYPGAPVLLTRFARGQETGDVRVQDYGDLNRSGSRYRIGQFLPGVVECSPGDTPKVWPEVHQHVGTWDEAFDVFTRYVEEAKASGWQAQEDDPNG